MMRRGRVAATVVASISLVGSVTAEPVGTVFTYQGQLKQGALPANDTGDLAFELNGAGMNSGALNLSSIDVVDGPANSRTANSMLRSGPLSR